MARSSSDDNAMCYVLSFLWSEWAKINDVVYVSSSSLGGHTEGEVCRLRLHLVFNHFAFTHSRLQQIHNSLARILSVVKSPKSCHITPILRSLHWLRITELIEYKLLSLTYKDLATTQPPYLHKIIKNDLISVQCPRSTRSSSIVILARPPSSFSLKITDRPFRYASPCLWNQLPLSLRQPYSGTSSSISDSSTHSPITSSSFNSPLCSSITLFLSFTPGLKPTCYTNPTPRSFTFSCWTASTDCCLHRFF